MMLSASSHKFTGSAALVMSTTLKVFDNPPDDFDKYDVCLEFPVDAATNKLTQVGAEVLNQLIGIFGSKYISLFYSRDTSKIYALIRAALKLVKSKAETDRFKLLLDANLAKERAFDGDEEARVNGFSIPHVPEVSPIEPFEYIFGEYVSRPDAQDLYFREEGSSHPFTKLVRIKLLSRMLHEAEVTEEGEHQLSLEYLRLGGVVMDYYAVHDLRQLADLRERWLTYCFAPWNQPILEIKNYFGEKTGFYFFFLGFISLWFLAPVLIGIAFQVTAVVLDNYNRPELPAFAFFISIWALTMIRHWRRTQKITAMKWNTLGVSHELAEREVVRYDYYGQNVRSAIDGSETVYFHPAKRTGFYFMSAVFMLLTIGACLVSVAALFYVRHLIRVTDGVNQYDQWILPAMISLQISIANRVIYLVASGLTRLENHRLDEDFDYALTSKLFFMQFINASSSFYYLAFFARRVPDDDGYAGIPSAVRGCGPEDCITTLAVHVLVVVATQVVFSVAVYYWIPYFARLVYNFRCDMVAWYNETRETLVSWYNWWSECCMCVVNSSLAQCCIHVYESWHRCCCGDPLPTPVPLVRTNIGQGPDRSTHRSVSDRTRTSARRPYSADLTHGRQIVLAEIDDVSDLDDSEALALEEGRGEGEGEYTEEKGQDLTPLAHASPRPQSLADLRIGLTAHNSLESPMRRRSADGTNRHPLHPRTTPKAGEISRNSAVLGEISRNSAVLGADDAQVREDDHSLENRAERAFVRYYKFDQDHQLRRSYARVLLILSLILCFGTLFPASFLLGALLLRSEVRGKAWQLLMVYKRTFPFEVEDIGSCWNRIFQGIGTLTVLTNAALISFAMTQFDEWSWLQRVLLFIGIVLACRVYQAMLDFSLDEVPPEVVVQQKRTRFINDKLIRKVPDRKNDYAMEIL